MSDAEWEFRTKVSAISRDVTMENIQASAAIYAPQHEVAPFEGVDLVRDVYYGPHDRNRLDVFKPEPAADGPLPVFVFVHGGGFVRGDKCTPGSPYNDNVPLWAVRNGLIAVNITYRYAPEFQFPSGAQDVAAAIAWVREHVAEHGGDRERIFLAGTSAGAAHVAGYVTGMGGGAPETDIKGAILLSCIFDPVTADKNEFLHAYYGEDESEYADRSSLPGLIATKVPLLVTLAEYDPEDFERQALLFTRAWFEQKRAWPNLIRLKGHNHLTTTFHLNSADKRLGRELLRFIADNS